MSNKLNVQYNSHSEQREESYNLHGGQTVYYNQGDNSVTASKSIILLVLLAICLFDRSTEAKYGGGTGEPNSPYLIFTAEQMNAIGADANDWDKHFKLMADIDLAAYTGTDFNIIGGRRFREQISGVFNGNGHKISNFSYKARTVRDATALFSYVGRQGIIKDLGLIGPNVDAGLGEHVGALVGENNGTITGCYAHGGIVSGQSILGGLVGYNSSGTINNCYYIGRVSGNEVLTNYYVGGLVGTSAGGEITNCYATTIVDGDRHVGGLVGSAGGTAITESYASGSVSGNEFVGGLSGYSSGTITNCYSLASVSGYEWVGGLVGQMGSTNAGTITNCYATGEVTGTIDVGGLVGFKKNGLVFDSFWDTQNSGQSASDGGTGKIIAEMQMQSTFTDADWDFIGGTENGAEDIWCICEGQDYPKLTWQFVIGDFDGDDKTDFVDFCLFAARWLQGDSNFFCDGTGTDLTNDGNVDFYDLKEFAENWLAVNIWSLSEGDYLIVDDFESYNDLAPSDPKSNRIFDTWLDGYDNPATNGSVIGYDDPPFTEQSIVHGGMQSMPYSYNTFFKFSKAELLLSPPQDWTEEDGIGVLSLWFRGDKTNAASPMSVVLNGSSVVYHDNPNAVQIDTWTEWTIELQRFIDVNLTNVNSIAICFGIENDPQPGGSGKVFFDDIRLRSE
jgi:hypothetical protein